MKKERIAALPFRKIYGGHGSKPKKSRARRFIESLQAVEETQEISGSPRNYVRVEKRQ
jgi:hypothetical protein